MTTGKSFINARALQPEIRRELSTVYHRMLPYGGSFYDTTDQVTVGANQVNLMSYNTTVLADGVFVSNSNRVNFSFPGWYIISFSAQFDKPSANAAEIDVWLRKNGTNVNWSNTVVNVAGSNAEIVASWDWAVRPDAGDYFQIAWSSPATDVEVHARPAGTSPTRPAVPSVILNVWPVFGFSVTS